jgi:hypothetical protein
MLCVMRSVCQIAQIRAEIAQNNPEVLMSSAHAAMMRSNVTVARSG